MALNIILKHLPFQLRWYILHLRCARHQGIWRFLPWIGRSVIVPWPVTDLSADPNDLIRPWLEEIVGKQGVYWSWGIASTNSLEVKFLNKQHAMMFKLIYG